MATQKTLAPTNQTITIAGFQGEKPDQRQIADAETKMADAINALNSQLVYKSNDTIEIGANNAMYAGRVGWSGKQVWFTVPLDKPVASGISTVSITGRGTGTIFLCTANSAVSVGLNDFSDITAAVIQGGRMALTFCFYFDTAPLSITDGIVNVMLNTKFTIKF